MSGTKYKEWILETIDQLRKRKARPDLERITHMVQRKHGLTFRETEALLEKLVDSEVVIKVDYKGSTSYRNAAKWRKSHLSGHVLNSNQASSRIKVAVRAIAQTTAAAAESSSNNNNNNNSSSGSSSTAAAAAAREAAPPEKRGASLREIEKWLSAQKGPLLKSQLLIAMQREVESGRLKKLESGEYVAVDAEAEKPSEAKSPPPKVVSPAAPPGPTKRGRPASKRKRFKKTPGPEFETEDLIKIEQDPKKCDACLQTAERNKYGEPEELLACKDCSTKVHPSCMDYSAELAERARNSPWQCIECKTCYVCDDSGDGGSMLFCDACDKGYHMKCHSPPVYEKPKGKWVCGTCVCEGNDDNESMEFETSASDISQHPSPSPTAGDAIEGAGPSCLPTPCDSPVQPDPDNKENLECQEVTKEEGTCSLPKLVAFDGTYPDAADWTIEDVVSFFKSAGFIEQAEAFSEQEIDGKSLLLMKRSDVLTGLSVKLGPALKMYTHVRNLQLVGQNISSAHW